MDIIMENMKENKKLNNELMFKKRNINGIVPTTEDRNILLALVTLVNRILTPINIT